MTKQRWQGFSEFPRILDSCSGNIYRSMWLQGEEYIDGLFRSSISRIDDNGSVIKHILDVQHLCSEGIPLTKECGLIVGSIASLVFDAILGKSYYLLLDPDDLSFQARIDLNQTIPLTFHGTWVASK